MNVSVSLFAPEPGSAGFPAASRPSVIVKTLVEALRRAHPAVELDSQWLQPPEAHASSELGGWIVTTRWSTGELRRMLRDRSHFLLFVYPLLPVLAYSQDPAMLQRLLRAVQALRAKSRLSRQRTVVLVAGLPAEMAEGQATADGRVTELDVERIREIERVLFCSAHRVIAPAGFADLLSERYGLDPAHLWTFRRHAYFTETADQQPPLEFDNGDVNFFYSGAVSSEVASNFREVLRSIRNAPNTRLHICGPGRDSLREWLAELDVPNVRHHGLLGIAEHDWLAQRCDVGLILHPGDNPYNHIRPTLKYSAYLANGLAVLSTDLRCVAQNIRLDGVGLAMPIRELALELLRWATRPTLWAAAKARSTELAAELRSPAGLQAWVAEIAEGR